MEIEVVTLKPWMCRICLEKGNYNIFKDWLGGRIPLAITGQLCHQGSSKSAVSIVDALNCFSQFKVSQSEINIEPMMLCENCHRQLVQCYLFRKKVQDAEILLHRDLTTSKHSQNIDYLQQDKSKSDITQQFADFNSRLSHNGNLKQIPANKLIQKNDGMNTKQMNNKVYHAKPRFKLTNQVSNILRHVTVSNSRLSSVKEKRTDSTTMTCSTPKRIKQEHNSVSNRLEKTLIIPSYVFEKEENREKHVLHVKGATISTSCPIRSEEDVDRNDSKNIFYCTHCPKAFSAPYHLLVHTRSSHLCQHCLKLFHNVSTRNKHIRDEHKLFRCSLCNFQSQYVTNLRSHLKKSHSVTLPAHVSILQKTCKDTSD
ncbi:uncharacterized protein LOC129717969 [Wyeomyia smithii]|uniref:uncharacterized protein LOC129717969 n=1 Tax=Wyeomyia smithii TaxID=174621 RepID=UPI002468217D|nr:uncharacterized protein LOC129717969 [Wyeomyia smithii]